MVQTPRTTKPPFLQEARLLRVLAHPGRLAILAALRNGSACVCHLTVALGRSQAYVSQQLAILRDAGLLEARREGTFVSYRLQDYGILGMVDLISRFLGRTHPPVVSAATRLEGCACPQCRPATRATPGGPP